MSRKPLLAVALLSVLVPGCEQDRYTIEMRAAGHSLERRFVWSREGVIPDEEAAAVAKLYKERVKVAGDAQGFFGIFSGSTPSDVGGAGSYMHFESTVGTASIYVERFRGNDSPLDTLEKRRELADKLTDLLIGWFDAELQDRQGYAALREFMSSQLRADLRDLASYLWVSRSVPGQHKQQDEEIGMRIGQYLAERGYFSAKDLPAVTRALSGDAAGEGRGPSFPHRIVPIMQRLAATRMGVPAADETPECLAFLSASRTAWSSLEAYVRGTEQYQQMLRKWEEDSKAGSAARRPLPEQIPQAIIINMLGLTMLKDYDRVTVSLVVPNKPFMTNGTWNEAATRVEWSGRIELKSDTQKELPMVCYAVWSTPNAIFQREHFGDVPLVGQNLFSYCMWRGSLLEEEAAQWDEFVASLEPGDGLVDRIAAFRFSGQEAGGQKAGGESTEENSKAAEALRLIQNGLEACKVVHEPPPEPKEQPPAP